MYNSGDKYNPTSQKMSRNHIATKPIYNIKSVSKMTGIPSVTLRAWERRYGFPSPERSDSGYRLYSDHEIAALNWLKMQTESGLSIGQAVKLLQDLMDRGESPLPTSTSRPAKIEESHPQSLEHLRDSLLDALVRINQPRSIQILETAFQLYPLETALMEIIQPALIEIGDRWHRGEITIATEHFSTNLCRTHLLSVLESTEEGPLDGQIIAACAPGEWHELGLLMVTLMLCRRGWNVIYLGANLGLHGFAQSLQDINPDMVLFSATSPETAARLGDLTGVLDQLPDPKPIIGLGGQAFLKKPSLINQLPGTFLGLRADIAVSQIERMLSHIHEGRN